MSTSIFRKSVSLPVGLLLSLMLVLFSTSVLAQSYHMRMVLNASASSGTPGAGGPGGPGDSGSPGELPPPEFPGDAESPEHAGYSLDSFYISDEEAEASGTYTTDVFVQVVDGDGQPVPGVPVLLSANAGSFASSVIVTNQWGYEYGEYTYPLLDQTQTITIAARIQGVAASTKTVTVLALKPLPPGPRVGGVSAGFGDTEPSDGTHQVAVTAAVRDENGNDVPGVTIVFGTDGGTLNSTTAVSNEWGMAEVLLTMPLRNHESTITVTAQVQGQPDTLRVATINTHIPLLPEHFSWNGTCATHLLGVPVQVTMKDTLDTTKPGSQQIIWTPFMWNPGESICNAGDVMRLRVVSPLSSKNVQVNFNKGEAVWFPLGG